MQNTYTVHCTQSLLHTTQYCTLTLKGSNANVAKYLHAYVESADIHYKTITTLEAYLAVVREYMEENGGCAIWDVLTSDGEEVECYKNGYEWGDEWECATENGHGYITLAVDCDEIRTIVS